MSDLDDGNFSLEQSFDSDAEQGTITPGQQTVSNLPRIPLSKQPTPQKSAVGWHRLADSRMSSLSSAQKKQPKANVFDPKHTASELTLLSAPRESKADASTSSELKSSDPKKWPDSASKKMALELKHSALKVAGNKLRSEPKK